MTARIEMTKTDEQHEQRRRARITAIKLAAIALAFYVGFIVIGALRG